MTSSLTVSSTTKSLLIGLSIGTLATLLIASQLGLPFFNNETDASDLQSDEKAPLYWVAPMDDSYRRDKPGKSPMGMDLVPVYASDTTQSEDNTERTPGTVMIPPNVQQNMGVKIEPVRVGTLEQEISALGTVAYDEDSIVHIHPRVEGWVDTLFIKSQGEQVDKGQALYTLYSPELVSAQEEYVLALKRGDARLIDGAAENAWFVKARN
jgi:membrane fusion protein, copper/silver efflux system